MSLALANGPDDVAIRVGSTDFKGWQSVNVTCSCESIPNSFQLTASTEFLQDRAALENTRAGQACQIRIGSDLVITGCIDRRSIGIDARSHQVTLSGRGITRNLVDCSADLFNDPGVRGGITANSMLDLAQKLSKAYGITVISAVPDLGGPIPYVVVNLGETPWQVIESVAAYTGYLVYEDPFGRLVLDRVGSQRMASGFTLPGNIEAIGAERSADQRFSDYVVVWNSTNSLSEQNALSNQRWHETDPGVGQYRLKITVSQQNAPGNPNFGMTLARWQKARFIGRSQAAQITCDSWRDTSGRLWTPNWLATVEAPIADITGAVWVIGTVTYRKDMSGTHADLVLMPSEAFSPDPSPLNLWDAELLQKAPTSQNPAPPSTSRS